MRHNFAWVVLWMGFIVLSSSDLSAQERWVYRYNGPGNYDDVARSILVGTDGNLYAAGWSEGDRSLLDFTVASLGPSGEERWVYRYDGPGNWYDVALSIVMGTDDNLYAAGWSEGSGTYIDFIVVGLTPSGAERWTYRRNGPGGYYDMARSVVAGPGGYLYIAGWTTGSGTGEDFTVVGLDTSGTEQWVYSYDGPESGDDGAYSIVVGMDGNLYAVGRSRGTGTQEDLTAISLDRSGVERWVYRYNGPGDYYDGAWSIVMAADGNVYVAGESSGIGTEEDFTVISLDTSGTERWVYRYNGPGDGEDVAYSIATGPDSNVYVAGWSLASGTSTDLAVISLTPAGAERWVYRYNGPGSGLDAARAVVVGADGNLYAAGSSLGSGTNWDLVVISLTRSGGQRWVYRYNGPEDHRDEAYAIVMGADTNLYVAGASVGSGTYYDFTVIGLTRDIGVEERREGRGPADAGLKARVELFVSPTPALRRVNICYSLPAPGEVVLSVYDACGTLVKTLVDSREEAGSRNITWNGRDEDGDEVAGGTYFCRLSMSKLSTTKKLLLLR